MRGTLRDAIFHVLILNLLIFLDGRFTFLLLAASVVCLVLSRHRSVLPSPIHRRSRALLGPRYPSRYINDVKYCHLDCILNIYVIYLYVDVYIYK